MEAKTRIAIVLSVSLVATGVLWLPSAGALPEQKGYVAGGAAAEYTYPPDPFTLLTVRASAGWATCDPPADHDSIGGACFDVGEIPDGDSVRVTVRGYDRSGEQTYPTFVAGFDLDGDGCVGCTSEDHLERGRRNLLIPVPEGEGTLAVFVDSASAETDVFQHTSYRSAVNGMILVENRSADLTGSSEDATASSLYGSSVGLEPHLCVPACST